MNKQGSRKFIGKTSSEAMAVAKAQMGNDAMILNQRNLVEIIAASPSGGQNIPKAFYGSTVVEVMASVCRDMGPEATVLERNEVVELLVVPPEKVVAEGQRNPGNALIQKAYGAAMSAYNHAQKETQNSNISSAVTGGSDGGFSAALLKEINEKLEHIHRIAKSPERPSVNSRLIDYYYQMIDNDVTEDIARHLVEKMNEEIDHSKLQNPGMVRDAMLNAISRLIPVSEPIKLRGDGKPTVVVVVGPTGVGKTTSIAKLSMQFKLQHRCKVGLITEDTSRPGAEEQLRSVAQLLSIPLTVADTVDRIRKAISMSSDRDIIFIDTAGRVPKNKESIDELAEFLKLVDPDEVHLALCGLSGHKHVLDTIRRFDSVCFDKLMLTKLDEATTYGLILNVAAHVDKGLSYITTGQDYMENIEPGNSSRLASLVLGDELNQPGS